MSDKVSDKGGGIMRFLRSMAIAASATLMAAACGSPEPAREPVREESAAETAAAELQRKINDEAAQLDKRAGEIERRWMEMEGKMKEKSVAPTAALRTAMRWPMRSRRTPSIGRPTQPSS